MVGINENMSLKGGEKNVCAWGLGLEPGTCCEVGDSQLLHATVAVLTSKLVRGYR